MGSKNPLPTYCDPKLRSTIEQAFNATWTVLQARDPLRDFEQDYELKIALNRKLSLPSASLISIQSKSL